MIRGSDEVSISAKTKLLGVIGDPVSHSLSPLIHNAALSELALDYVYLAFRVPAYALGAAVEGFRAFGIRGLSVTMPHKAKIGQYLDSLSESSKALNSVNTVYWDTVTGRLCGTSTDGAGFIDGLKLELDFTPSDKVVGVIGTGGAARSIVWSLANEGASQVRVFGRNREKVEQTLLIGGDRCKMATLESLRDCDLLVNATPVGMNGQGDDQTLPVPEWVLQQEMLICDIVYSPIVTAFMQTASAKGCKVLGGLPMLLHQAARAFKHFTGFDPPLQAMTSALESRLQLGDIT